MMTLKSNAPMSLFPGEEMTAGSLFSGIGGFDLGMERAGFDIRWQVEIDPWCRRVLAKHWPDVTRYEDIRDVKGSDLEPVECLFGGFPCQDISQANINGKGLGGDKSGLWSEFRRLIGEIRPKYIAVENVSNLLGRGFGIVLGDLSCLGYRVEGLPLPACAFGAPQMRKRVFIVGYSSNISRVDLSGEDGNEGGTVQARKRPHQQLQPSRSTWWDTETGVDRVVDGVPSRLDKRRLIGLGNAVVPIVAEYVGRRVMEASKCSP